MNKSQLLHHKFLQAEFKIVQMYTIVSFLTITTGWERRVICIVYIFHKKKKKKHESNT
jgi:hypothetical protein